MVNHLGLLPVPLLKTVFWASAGALAWTHVGYPLTAAALARRRPKPVRRRDNVPGVTLIVAAHDEEAVIEDRLRNLLELDYPPARLQIVVASDASTDGTDQIVERVAAAEPSITLLRCPRAGKVAAQNLAVARSNAKIVAFSDANASWAPDALTKLVRGFGDPEVAYVCGRLSLLRPDGTNREGVYWRYETWLREQESLAGSVTGGNGAIYAVRRSNYVDVDPRFGHDLALPYLMVQQGRRAVYEPEAHAFEKPSRDLEDEYARKVRMVEHAWLILLTGRMFRGLPPSYLVQLVSHRVLRYASGFLHLAMLVTNLPLAARSSFYRTLLAAQAAGLALAAAGRMRAPLPGAALAYYYALVTWAMVVSFVRYLRFGVPAVWEKAEGTR
jgi:cellulose synthase/poly-beta-1,6-N-acetylglucosamine synthase-like glycosyltransferase